MSNAPTPVPPRPSLLRAGLFLLGLYALIFIVISPLFAPAFAQTVVYQATQPTLTNGQRVDVQSDVRGSQRVILMTNAQNTSPSVATTMADAVSNAAVDRIVTGAHNQVFNGTSWDRQRGDTTGVYVVPTAHATLGGATVRSSASSELSTGFVAKASAGNLFDWSVMGGAGAGFLMVFNSATVPADGAVTPAFCIPVPASGYVSGTPGPAPYTFGTGISVVYSSTGCFTKTAAASGFIMVSYK